MAENKEEICEMGGTVTTRSGHDRCFQNIPICQPCSTEKALEATGFCIDCKEWLCEECFKYHRRPTPMRNHELRDMEQMNSTMPLAIKTDTCTQTCDEHEGKRIKYFCSEHEYVGCSVCVIENHRGCFIENISNLSHDFFNKPEFTKLMDLFMNMRSRSSKEIENEIKLCTDRISRTQLEALNSISAHKKELSDTLDEVEDSLKGKCSSHAEAKMKKLESVNEKWKTVQTKSHAIICQIDSLKERGKNCDAFVAMKRAARQLIPLEDNINETFYSIRDSNYSFQPNKDILQTLKKPDGMGILINDMHHDQHYTNMKAQYIAGMSILCEGNDACRVTGSAQLSSNLLVLVDHDNEQIKLVDMDKNIVISYMDVECAPWSVAIMNDKTFAVTVVYKHKILIMTTDNSGKLSCQKSLAVSGQCLGIVHNDGRLFVTFNDPDKVEVIDMAGCVLHCLATTGVGPQLLAVPQHITLSHDKQSVFVSNLENNTVICMNLDGTVVATYCDDELFYPQQAAVDENGMIFVAAYTSKTVHIITPMCKKVKVILNETDGLSKHITSISYCGNRKRLYIGMAYSNEILVFEIN